MGKNMKSFNLYFGQSIPTSRETVHFTTIDNPIIGQHQKMKIIWNGALTTLATFCWICPLQLFYICLCISENFTTTETCEKPNHSRVLRNQILNESCLVSSPFWLEPFVHGKVFDRVLPRQRCVWNFGSGEIGIGIGNKVSLLQALHEMVSIHNQFFDLIWSHACMYVCQASW